MSLKHIKQYIEKEICKLQEQYKLTEQEFHVGDEVYFCGIPYSHRCQIVEYHIDNLNHYRYTLKQISTRKDAYRHTNALPGDKFFRTPEEVNEYNCLMNMLNECHNLLKTRKQNES
jgi:hypothetical protein